jgi:hypothetical protein
MEDVVSGYSDLTTLWEGTYRSRGRAPADIVCYRLAWFRYIPLLGPVDIRSDTRHTRE